MIGKADMAAGIVAAGSALIAQASDFEVLRSLPGIGEVANLSAVGAMIYLVLWTIPKLTQDFRDEMKEEREFHREENEKMRQAFKCEGK